MCKNLLLVTNIFAIIQAKKLVKLPSPTMVKLLGLAQRVNCSCNLLLLSNFIFLLIHKRKSELKLNKSR